MANPRDMVSLRYVLGYKDDSFKTGSYKKLLAYSEKNKISVFDVLGKCAKLEITATGVDDLVRIYVRIMEEIADIKKAVIEDRKNLVDALSTDIPEDRMFRELLEQAIKTVRTTNKTTVDSWLRSIHKQVSMQISSPASEIKDDCIRIMSLHASKGLNAKYVVIMNVNSDVLPSKYHGESEYYIQHLEEQRRLFYVAVTRCKGSNLFENTEGGSLCEDAELEYPGTLIISTKKGRTSKFIGELSK
jgi:DNA helicase-2/ATP-dependent DNA helicase PcrA